MEDFATAAESINALIDFFFSPSIVNELQDAIYISKGIYDILAASDTRKLLDARSLTVSAERGGAVAVCQNQGSDSQQVLLNPDKAFWPKPYPLPPPHSGLYLRPKPRMSKLNGLSLRFP